MITLHIASPGKDPIEKEVERVGIKLVEGNVEILPNHINFISLIKNGYVKFNNESIDIEDGVVHFEDNNLFVTYFK